MVRPARLEIVPGAEEALEIDVGVKPANPRRVELDVPLVAIGWATVELDRWASFAPAPAADDTLLGARCAIVADAAALSASPAASSVPVALLEPSTEGRLAAFLARHGEGPAVLYLAAQVFEDRSPGDQATGSSPFGPARLVSAGRRGPFLVLCAGASLTAPAPRTIQS